LFYAHLLLLKLTLTVMNWKKPSKYMDFGSCWSSNVLYNTRKNIINSCTSSKHAWTSIYHNRCV